MITAPLTLHHVILTPALPREESESIITNEQEQYILLYIYIFPGLAIKLCTNAFYVVCPQLCVHCIYRRSMVKPF